MKFSVKFKVFDKGLVKEVEAESLHAAQAKFLEEFKQRFEIVEVEPIFTENDDDKILHEMDTVLSSIFGKNWAKSKA